MLNLKVGDKVIFDTARVDEFKRETSNSNDDLKTYQKIVIGGINQVGIVIKIEENLAWIKYPDGWEIPIPIMYLIVF